jgi:hypothetical protein
MNANTIINNIKKATLNNDDINAIVAAIKSARMKLTRESARKLSIGSKVTFKDRNGIVYVGVVNAVKIKNASVTISSPHTGCYAVPMNMLEIL